MSTQPITSVFELVQRKLQRKFSRRELNIIDTFLILKDLLLTNQTYLIGSSHFISPREHFSFKSYTRTPKQLAQATNGPFQHTDITRPSALESMFGFSFLRKFFSYSVSLSSPEIVNYFTFSMHYSVHTDEFSNIPTINLFPSLILGYGSNTTDLIG